MDQTYLLKISAGFSAGPCCLLLSWLLNSIHGKENGQMQGEFAGLRSSSVLQWSGGGEPNPNAAKLRLILSRVSQHFCRLLKI